MQQCNGIYLLEVLISYFILSVILLGLDAVLIFSLQHSKATYYASIANRQLNNLAEFMIAAKHTSLTEPFIKWNQQNHDVLPQGRGNVNNISSPKIISIFWGKTDQEQCKANQIGQSGCLHLQI